MKRPSDTRRTLHRCCRLVAAIVFLIPVSTSAIVGAECGDGAPDAGEHCDDGGICVGGARAGSTCASEEQCGERGACFGGLDDLRVCTTDQDCRDGVCRRCRPVGGDGCAANCTTETEIFLPLIDGVVPGGQREPAFGTSGVTLFGFATIAQRFTGSLLVALGHPVGGVVPITIKEVNLSAIRSRFDVVCACVRPQRAWTCGGTATDADGTKSPGCDPASAIPAQCPTDRPCAPVYGATNFGSGFIGCGTPAATADHQQDCNEIRGGAALVPKVRVERSAEFGEDTEAHALFGLGIEVFFNECSSIGTSWGSDGVFCTDDDPNELRGATQTLGFTSGTASSIVLNAHNSPFDEGPEPRSGRAAACHREDDALDLEGMVVVGATTECDRRLLGDSFDNLALAFGPPVTPGPSSQCAGDCDEGGSVTVDELLTTVGVALGVHETVRCAAADADRDGEVSAHEIVGGITAALHGCVLSSAADLVPVRAIDYCSTCCGSTSCAPMHMAVCTRNRGGVAAGPFRIVVNDGLSATLDVPGVAPFDETCVSTIYDPFAREAPADIAIVRVDAQDGVDETDESNNVLVIPAPVRTKCDIICPGAPKRAPTPKPTTLVR